MKDIDYIKNFSKITISGICRKLRVDRSSVLNNKAKEDKIKKVREEIENQVARLYIKEDSKDE